MAATFYLLAYGDWAGQLFNLDTIARIEKSHAITDEDSISSGDVTNNVYYMVVDAGTGADFSGYGGPASPAEEDVFQATSTGTPTWGSPPATLAVVRPSIGGHAASGGSLGNLLFDTEADRDAEFTAIKTAMGL
jgi:hypothetical protein